MPLQACLHLPLEPFVQHGVQDGVRKHRADHAPNNVANDLVGGHSSKGEGLHPIDDPDFPLIDLDLLDQGRISLGVSPISARLVLPRPASRIRPAGRSPAASPTPGSPSGLPLRSSSNRESRSRAAVMRGSNSDFSSIPPLRIDQSRDTLLDLLDQLCHLVDLTGAIGLRSSRRRSYSALIRSGSESRVAHPPRRPRPASPCGPACSSIGAARRGDTHRCPCSGRRHKGFAPWPTPGSWVFRGTP